VVGKDVFDVTGFIDKHPGGLRAILRKSGGIDCRADLELHGKGAQKMWKGMKIGQLCPCPSERVAPTFAENSSLCVIM
jgi:cytochrome b involved in lipid metabolism